MYQQTLHELTPLILHADDCFWLQWWSRLIPNNSTGPSGPFVSSPTPKDGTAKKVRWNVFNVLLTILHTHLYPELRVIITQQFHDNIFSRTNQFLLEASFGFGYCRRPCVCVRVLVRLRVRVCVHQPRACPDHNTSPPRSCNKHICISGAKHLGWGALPVVLGGV